MIAQLGIFIDVLTGLFTLKLYIEVLLLQSLHKKLSVSNVYLNMSSLHINIPEKIMFFSKVLNN